MYIYAHLADERLDRLDLDDPLRDSIPWVRNGAAPRPFCTGQSRDGPACISQPLCSARALEGRAKAPCCCSAPCAEIPEGSPL